MVLRYAKEIKMSWVTEFSANVLIRNTTINSVEEAETLIEITEIQIDKLITTLKMLASGNIKELTPNDAEPIDFASNTVDELLLSIREKTILIAYLNLYLGANGENKMSKMQF